MLDSLVRVSRRVGRATDTDAAEAVTSNVADDFRGRRTRAPSPASRRRRGRRRSVVRASAFADVTPINAFPVPSSPATRGGEAGNEPPSRAARPQPRRFAGLPVPVAALTVEKCVERTLLSTTTRRDSTLPTRADFANLVRLIPDGA